MKIATLVRFLLVPGAETLIVVSSFQGKEYFPYFSQQQQQQQIPLHDTGNHARRHKRHRARPNPSLLFMALDSSVECDSRICGDPAALERWICGVGGMIGPVVLEDTPNKGWGLRAAQDFGPGETVAVIPRSACLGLPEHDAIEGDAWTGPPNIHALMDQVPERFADVRLGLLLLHERFNVGSYWAPYVNNLPRIFRGVPISSFNALEMRALQDRDLAADIDERCKFMMKFVSDTLDPMGTGSEAAFGEKKLTFGELAWATAAVGTRAFTHLCGEDQDASKPLLVPLADMLNFNFAESNVAVVPLYPSDDEDLKGASEKSARPEIRLVTTRPVAAGDSLEILENVPNAERLCKYGFVDVNRSSELCAFTFEKKVLRAARMVAGILDEPFGARFEADALEPWQQKVLIEVQLDGPDTDLNVHLGGDSTRGRLPVDDRLMAALRVMFARSKRDLQGKTAIQLGRYKTGKLSVYVEQRMLATVLGLSLIYVQSWPTTLEQDEVVLYGRRVSPTLYEALKLPPPWQVLAEQVATQRDLVKHTVAVDRVREEKETTQGCERERKEEVLACTRIAQEETGVYGEGEGGGGPEERYTGGEDEENGASVGRGLSVLEVNPELRWELTQAIGYRLAKKRTIMDVGLLARAELIKTGLTEGMKANARMGVGALSEWVSDGSDEEMSAGLDDSTDYR